MKKLASLLLLAFPLALGCSGSGTNGTGGAGGGGTGGTGGTVFSADPPLVLDEDERPAMVAIPSDYDPTKSHPLVILLHGFGAWGELQANFWQMFDVIDEKQFVFVYPDGIDMAWNSTDACCNPTGEVDDVGYISGLIEEAQEVYNIDPKRVYLMGHSNGGSMSFRMACERSDLITAIVTLAGWTFDDPADCQPATVPVSVLAVHGTEDQTIPYAGSTEEGFEFPGAIETTQRFAARAGCDPNTTEPLGNIDLTEDYDGPETEQVGYTSGCDEGLDVELWTIVEDECVSAGCNPHIPIFTAVWADVTVDWLFRHSR
jgi:polyhydroxybutyrate depolymerase